MPVMKPPLPRPSSAGQTPTGNGEMVLKNLADQLLREDEMWVFKQTLQHFRMTRSVASLCTALRPLIISTERLMLLVELSYHLPTEPLRRDFHKLCTLHFPKYHTFLRYFTPQPVTDGSKIIAQDATGQLLVTSKMYEKKHKPSQNGTLTSEARHDATSIHGAESGFYSEHDDISRHGNGARGSVSSMNSPPQSAPSTLHRTARLSLPHPLSQRVASPAKRQSMGALSSGPLKILSGSFQSLAWNKKHGVPSAQHSEDSNNSALNHKRILLARRSDGSLGVGIKGGKEYGTPIVVYVIEEGCQAEQQGLKVGDRIIDVNGTDFSHLTHAEAVTLMRNAWNIIMTVESHNATNGRVAKESEGRSQDGTLCIELEVLVYPGNGGRLGCVVNRDEDRRDIVVKSVERSSAASKAGLLKGDCILEIDGIVVNALSEKQIATLTHGKCVRLRVQRKAHLDRTTDSSTSHTLSPKDTANSDIEDSFTPLDFSSPASLANDHENTFNFAASTPRNPGRSHSEDRILSTPREPYSIPIHPEGWTRTETGGDNPSHGLDTVPRIYRPRTMAVPSSNRQHSSGVKTGGGRREGAVVQNMATRGRPLVRQPPPTRQPTRYTVVYSVRGRSADTIVHPDFTRRPPVAAEGRRAHAHATQSRSSKMRHIRNRSRSRDSAGHMASVTSADRDLLLAVQSGVEKRQRAVRLSLYQVPDGDDDWKI